MRPAAGRSFATPFAMRMKRAFLRAGAAAAVLTSLVAIEARPARADSTGPVPVAPPPLQSRGRPEVKRVHRKRAGLVAAGAVVFGLSYGGALVLSGLAINSRCCDPGMAVDFAIPIVGPVAGGPSPDRNIMIAWSAAQLGGALMLVYGLKGEDVDAVNEAPARRAGAAGPSMRLLPLLAHDAGGMVLAGRW